MDSVHSAVSHDDLCIQKDEFKKLEWFTIKARIRGLVGRVNISNVKFVADEILKENLIAARGLFCRAIMKFVFQLPHMSNVYAALVAVINSEFHDVGLLLVKRVVLQFKEAYDCKNKKQMQATSKFLAQLVNQRVVYESLAVNVLMHLLVNPTSDNVEVAVSFCTQCGSLLLEFVPHKLKEILEEFHGVLKKGALEKRVQVLIVKLFAAKRCKFKEYTRFIHELDVVDDEDQVTHDVCLLHEIDPEISVDGFKINSESHDVSQILIPCEDFEEDEVSSQAPSD